MANQFPPNYNRLPYKPGTGKAVPMPYKPGTQRAETLPLPVRPKPVVRPKFKEDSLDVFEKALNPPRTTSWVGKPKTGRK